MSEDIFTEKTEEGFLLIVKKMTHLTDPDVFYNGYIALPTIHKYFNLSYDDIEELFKKETGNYFDVNGGLTYHELLNINGDDYWVIGFDTIHGFNTPETQTFEFAKKELNKLYEQIKKVSCFRECPFCGSFDIESCNHPNRDTIIKCKNCHIAVCFDDADYDSSEGEYIFNLTNSWNRRKSE